MTPDRITIRLGTLRDPLDRRLAKLKQSPSEFIRRLIASELQIDSPIMRPGPVAVTGIIQKQVKYKVGAK